MGKKKYDQKPKVVVSDTTKEQLDMHKLVDSETYDSIIVRLIEKVGRISEGINLEDKNGNSN